MTLPNDEDLAQYEQDGDYHPDDERYVVSKDQAIQDVAKDLDIPEEDLRDAIELCAQAMYFHNEKRLNADNPWDWNEMPDHVQKRFLDMAKNFILGIDHEQL